jgi:serine/threonine protein kinase/formylglycine-generating enzyme required for sulfatase activity
LSCVRGAASIGVSSRYGAAPVRCLEENTLFEFVRGDLEGDSRRAVAHHADGCDPCRRLIAAAANVLSDTQGMSQHGHLRDASSPSSSRLAGKYELVRQLGAGGMGAVYEAINTLTRRRVAIKILHESFASDPNAVQRFMQEAQSASRIDHPNVVDILDLGHDPASGTQFMVQEFLTGSTLRERLRERGSLDADEVIRVVQPLVHALVVAHEAGVVHRDLKPENIFLAVDARGDEVIKLIDFGLSRPVREQDRLAVTDHGRQLGTPYYMSPEQLRAEVDIDDRTDVWSLGVVLFELIAGERPFRGPSYNELIVQILKEPVPRLGTVVPALPSAFDALVDRMLDRDRARRPSVRQVSDALDTLSRRARALPPGNPYRGLSAFEAEHRTLFFGRESEIRTLLDRLRADPLLLVAGDSGVGKSSLIRAGVLPLVGEGALDASGGATATATLTPGRHPVEALARALAPHLGEDEQALAAVLRDGPFAFARHLRDRAASARPLVLFVDQMEELITLSEAHDAQIAAAALATLTDELPHVRVVGSVRSDFLARLSALPRLGDRVTRALYLLRPLSPEGVRRAIVGPATLAGLRFESDALVDELVTSCARSPGALPLLQFTLAQLWEERDADHGTVHTAALARMGGVAGALAGHADGILGLLLPEHRPMARRIFTALVTPEGTRARRPASELIGRDHSAPRAVLEALVQGRLVTAEDHGVTDAPTYQIAHDILVDGWPTLRAWRSQEVERDALRQRLRRAADEWERLGRPTEPLWNRRQLAEAGVSELDELGDLERAFLDQSLRSARRRRNRQRALAVGVPLLFGLGYGGAVMRTQQHQTAAVRRHVADAEAALARARSDEREAEVLRQRAFDAFDHGRVDAGETTWARALAVGAHVEAGFARAGQLLEMGLAIDGNRRATRRHYAALLSERARVAEGARRFAERDELTQRMVAYDDDGAHATEWSAPARLTIETTPPGAQVIARRYDDGEPRALGGEQPLGTTPLAGAALAPGSYLLMIRAAGRPEVRHPVLVSHGERLRVALAVPASVPEGYAYIPPGRFLYGSENEDFRALLSAQPLHHAVTGGYFIGRHEVTFGEWLAFLRTLPAAERGRRRPHTPVNVRGTHEGAFVDVMPGSNGGARWTIQPTTRAWSGATDGAIRYPERSVRATQAWLRLPVSGISWDDARAYTAWLDRTGRLPGARPCDEHEWERAARGADDRLFPHGNRLQPDDANFDETYGRKPLAFGPDEVGAHPASDSPFGVADLAGNVWEWVTSVSDREAVVIRGGGWYQNQLSSRSNNHEAGEPSLRAIEIGLRICATAPPDLKRP